MNWQETVRSSLEAVRAHRMRSLLTMLGIIIGIASVILTVGLGLGAQKEVRDQIDALGRNLLIVSPGSTTDSTGMRGGFGSASTLDLGDAVAIADETVAPDIAEVAPVKTTQSSVTAGETNWTTQLAGTTPSWLDVRARTVAAGRFFTSAEAEAGADVAVLASDTAAELFGARSPVGQTIRIEGHALTVIGVLEQSGASTGGQSSEDDQVVVPMATAAGISGSASTSLSTIYVEADSSSVLGAAYQEVEALLSNLHQRGSGEADFTIATQDSLVDTANSTNQTMTVLLTGVAAISLLVGGIGVMNIMLVSVSERVQEIGLRKALGATPRSIRRQFLVEASLLGLVGGLIGLAFGITGAVVLPSLIDQTVTVSAWAAVGSVATALALGIGFGVYPAGRAARLTPIQALRDA